jgi:hypothetical protein
MVSFSHRPQGLRPLIDFGVKIWHWPNGSDCATRNVRFSGWLIGPLSLRCHAALSGVEGIRTTRPSPSNFIPSSESTLPSDYSNMPVPSAAQDSYSAQEWRSGHTYAKNDRVVLQVGERFEAYMANLRRKCDICLKLYGMLSNSGFRSLGFEQYGTHSQPNHCHIVFNSL